MSKHTRDWLIYIAAGTVALAVYFGFLFYLVDQGGGR